MRTRIVSLALVAAFAFPAAAQFDFRTTGTRSARILELRPTTGSAPSVSDAGSAKFFIPSSIGGYNTGNVYISQNGGAWTLLSSFVGSGAVSSVFGRTGAIAAVSGDYTATLITNTPAGGIAATTVQAALNELDSEKVGSASPTLTGDPLAPTAATSDNDTSIATTAFARAAIAAHSPVLSVFARTGAVTAVQADYDAFFTTTAEAAAAAPVQSVFGRTGAVTALQADYDSFFLTQTEGDNRYFELTDANLPGDLLISRSDAVNAVILTVSNSSSTTNSMAQMFVSTNMSTAAGLASYHATNPSTSWYWGLLGLAPLNDFVIRDGSAGREVFRAASSDGAVTLSLSSTAVAVTQATADNDTSPATTAHVHAAIAADAPEIAQDSIGSMSIDTATVDVTYTDATPELKWDVINDSITDAKLRNGTATSLIGRSANTSGDPADIACSATDQFFWRSGTSIVCATAASTNLSDTANIGRLNATNSWSANNTFTTFQTSGNVGLGVAASATTGQLLNVESTASGFDGSTIATTRNVHTGTSARAITRTVSDTATAAFQANGSGVTTSEFGQTTGGWAALRATAGNGLMVGSTISTPLILGTAATSRMHFSGTTANIGVNGTPSAVAGEIITVNDTADQLTYGMTVSNTNASGTAAAAILRVKADTAFMNFQSHGTARTVSRWGHAMGGWNEFLAVSGGLAMGTSSAAAVSLGVNSQTRDYMSGTPKNLTESTATGIAEVSLANNTVCGGTLFYTIDASDGTEYQALRGQVTFVAVSKAGTITSTAGTAAETTALSASTLTNTFTITNGAAKLTLNLNAVSGLTQTTLRANYRIVIDGGTCNVTPL